ncbi:hypothetical protein [Persicobacter psychrovividus]|uniref:Invasion protein n=1 Tax=Persicobacter psychrovividus TaxID=387638 RepID=A0ABN6L515_9BACT|nr:hypothetical protein PEPS_04700 [Persicobacter psychrovividus]
MLTGIKHLHTTVVILFTLWIVFKFIMMIAAPAKVDILRAKTKIADMILGFLVLATGLFLWMASGLLGEPLFMLKLAIVLVGTPLGIIGFRKKNIALAGISAAAFALLLLYMLFHYGAVGA